MEVGNIYQSFHQSLLTFIRSKIKVKEDAEDILQNVFVRISLNISHLSSKEKLRNWIYTIARNAIIDYYRERSRINQIAVDESFGESLINEGVENVSGLDGCMHNMINRLPEPYREILVDSEIHGTSQKELAQKYNMPYPSLRSRVQRGRERLKQLYVNCCHIEQDVRGNIVEYRTRNAGACKACDK